MVLDYTHRLDPSVIVIKRLRTATAGEQMQMLTVQHRVQGILQKRGRKDCVSHRGQGHHKNMHKII